MDLINYATIDLDPLTTDDFIWLKKLITDFVEETDSQVGHYILKNWYKECGRFVKVYNFYSYGFVTLISLN